MSEAPFESPGQGDPGRRRRRAGRRQRSHEDFPPWAWRCLCLAVVGSALLFGGLHTPTVVAVAAIVFLSAFLVLRGGGVQIPAPAKLLFALAAYTLLQAVPLPAALVRVLSPAAFEIWQGAFTAWGRSGVMSLSVDRGATLVEALKWAMYGAAFTSAAAYGAARKMARGVLLPIGAALCLAVITLAHGLAGLQSVYGVYRPSFGPSIWHIGPLLNPNHLASYLNVGIFCGFGLLVTRRQFVPRWLLGAAIAFLIPNAIIAGSRGGIVGLLAGVAIFFVALPRRREADIDYGPIRKRALLASVVGVLVVASVLTALLASDTTRRELYETNVDKLRLLAWVGRLLWDFKWFGTGRGAFEGVFSAYRTRVNHEVHTHPENIVAQWVAEWGVPVGLAALAAFFWLLRPKRFGRKWSAVGAGALAAVGAVFVHNLADFGLEVPAIALLVVAAAGVCYGHEAARVMGHQSIPAAPWSRVALGAGAGVSLVLCLLAAWWGGQAVSLDRLKLSEDFRSLKDASPEQVGVVREGAEALSLAHPAEPYFYRIGALLALRAEKEPMPLLGRALERGPMIGRTHLIIARVLASRRAVHQALLELRLAAGYDTALTVVIARAAVKLTSNYDDLMRAVPEGRDGCAMLVALARNSPPERRERFLLEAVTRWPSMKDALGLLINDTVRELERGEASERCGGERMAECWSRIERWLAALEQQVPHAAEPVLVRARLLQLKGEADSAGALLEERCRQMAGRDRAQCMKARLALAAKAKNDAHLATAARDFLAENCLDADGCAGALAQLGDVYSSKQDWDAALSFYDRAAHERSDDQLWMKVGQAALRTRSYQRAASALERVHARARFEPEYTRLLKLARAGQAATTFNANEALEKDAAKR